MTIRPEIQALIDSAKQTGIRPEIQELINQSRTAGTVQIGGDSTEPTPIPEPTPKAPIIEIPEETRPTIGQFARGVAGGAKREIGEFIGTGKQLIPAVGRDLFTLKFGSLKERSELSEKRVKQAIEVAKQSPEIAKDIVTDLGRTFGVDFQKKDNVSLNTAIQKFMDAPIESTLDILGLASIFKHVGKSLFKATSRKFNRKGKLAAQKIIGKNDVETKQILKNVSNKEVADQLDDVYAESNIIRKLDIGSQLDNPNYAEEIGKNSVKEINRLKKRDQIKLSSAIKKIKDQPVNKSAISEDIADELRKKGFLNEGTNVLDVEAIEPGLSKKALVTEIKKLNEPGILNAGTLKQRMDNISDKINWKKPKVADEGLMEVRRVYRNQLRSLSPDYDETALRISEKLDKFESQLRRFEKVGAGEKFGKSLFSTKQELDEFIELMEKTPDKLGSVISGDLKTLKAWHSWNRYFKQNPDFIIGEIPGAPKGLVPGIKKKVIKSDIALGRPRLRGLGRSIKQSKVPVRVGLELNQEEI